MKGDTCAKCESFTLEGGNVKEGIGRCLDYGHDAKWDDKFCVLFRPAPDMPKRLQFIAMRARMDDGNAAPA